MTNSARRFRLCASSESPGSTGRFSPNNVNNSTDMIVVQYDGTDWRQVVTANALLEGDAVWLTEDDRWTRRMEDAEILLADSGHIHEEDARWKIKRLKKRKLHLKDEIARLEDKLYPDIIA